MKMDGNGEVDSEAQTKRRREGYQGVKTRKKSRSESRKVIKEWKQESDQRVKARK